MRLHHHDAERLLYEKAQFIYPDASRWRAIRIAFNQQQQKFSEHLRAHIVTHVFAEQLKQEEGHIYFCTDGNVFILFQGKVSDIITRLSSQFQDLHFEFMDLSRDWEKFYTYCKAYAHPERVEPRTAIPVASSVRPPLRTLNAERIARNRSAGRERLLVLIVEDDMFTRRLVQGTLKTDYDIIEAGDGESALAAYEAYVPDAVFLDIELPDTSGHDVLSRILQADPGAFVVMLSANSNREHVLQAVERGAQGFTAKPFAREKLIHYLNLCETVRCGGPCGHHGEERHV